MQIKTADFGEITIDEASIINFPEGIPAFEEFHEYVLINVVEEIPYLYYMQGIGENAPCFAVIDPYYFVADYIPHISPADVKNLQCSGLEELRYLAIAIIESELEKSVMNLKSPLVICPETRKAKQIVLENDDYPLRYPLFVPNGKEE